MAEYQLSAQLRARDTGFSSKMRNAKKEVEGLERGIGSLKREDFKLKLSVDGMTWLERLQSAIQSARQNASKPLSVRLRDQASQQLSKIRNEIKALSWRAHIIAVNIKTIGAEKLSKLKSSLSEGVGGAAMGMGATMLGTAGVGYGVVNAFQSQMNFEKQMSSVKAILSGTYSGEELEKNMKTLTALAEKMGATTKFTAKEAGDALYYMGMAGWKTEQMVSGLPAVLSLAAAGDVELGQASDIVTDSMTAFGLKAGKSVKNAGGQMVESSQHYADLMAALVTNANTDVLQAGESLKYSAANVGAMFANGSYEDKMRGAEDLFLITGLQANAGIKGSQSGTAARALFARLGAQNRNASFALKSLGVDFTDENYGGKGEVRRIRDIIGDLRSRFKEGVSPEQLLDFAEELEDTKLNADTRRKLEGFILRAQANGGKLPGGEMLKMAAMLNGQEGMSGLLSVLLASEEDFNKLANAIDNCDGAAERMSAIKLDNLAGDITMLGSAWDAFQRNLIKGDASSGLREFTQGLTDTLSKANALFEDGIEIGDFFKIASDGITKLKNKFLELDGIGSLLAGGALFLGMKKLLQMGLKVKDTLNDLTKIRSASELGNALRGKKALGDLGGAATGAMASVGTMNVKAGVVNLKGPIKGREPRNKKERNKARVDAYYAQRKQFLDKRNERLNAVNQARLSDYYAQRQAILNARTPRPGILTRLGDATSNVSRIAPYAQTMVGAGALSAMFGAMNVMGARTNSEYTHNLAVAELKQQQAQLQSLKEQGADVEQIRAQLAAVHEAEMNVREVDAANHAAERTENAGAAGMVTGSMLGAAVGAAVPIIGPIIGGMLGGFLGEYGGKWFAEKFPERNQKSLPKRAEEGVQSVGSVAADAFEISGLGVVVREIEEEAATIEAERKLARIERVGKEAYQSEEVLKRRQTHLTGEQDSVRLEKKAVETRENLLQENKDAIKNFGYTTLGQNYLSVKPQAVQTPYRNLNQGGGAGGSFEKTRADELKGLNLSGITQPLSATTPNLQLQTPYRNLEQGKIESYKTRRDFRQPEIANNYVSPQTPYRNLEQGKTESYKTRQDFRQPEIANNYVSPQTPYRNLEQGKIESYKTRQDFRQPEIANNYVSPQTPYRNLEQSTVNLTKTFDSLKAKFTGEGNYTPATAQMQPYQPLQTPAINLNKEAFNVSSFFESLKTKYSGAETAAQDRNYSQPMANLPNYSANMPAMGAPPIELPEINITEKIRAEFESVSMTAATAWENLKTSTSSVFEEISNSISTGIESAKTTALSFGEEISNSMSAGIETAKSTVLSFSEEISTTFSSGFEKLQTSFLSFGESLSTSIESVRTNFSTFGEEIVTSFSSSFESLSVTASASFSSISATISVGVESARAMITQAFTSAASEVQGIWGAIPGFFSGIFGGIGGIASAAGSAIAAGINSGIGMIQSAWEALSGWLSAKISSLASMASSAAAAIGIGSNAKGTASWRGGLTEVNEHGGEIIILPSGKEIYPYQTTQKVISETKIAHNAKGTSFFSGGWSEVNEHGGEIMYLPQGTRIIPHATTVRILREQIKERLNDNTATANEITKNVGASLFTSEIGGEVTSQFNNVANASTHGYFRNNRTNDNRSARNNIFGREFETAHALNEGRKNDNVLQQSQRQNANSPTMATNVGFNKLRYSLQSGARNFQTNLGIGEQTTFNDSRAKTGDNYRVARNYSGTSYFEGGLSTVNEHGGEIITLPNGKNILPRFTFQNILKDSLGNIQGLNVPEYNRINEEDTKAVKRAKEAAQREQAFREQLKPATENLSKGNNFVKTRAISKNISETFFYAQNLSDRANNVWIKNSDLFKVATVFNPHAENIFNRNKGGVSISSPQEVFQNYKPQTRTIYNPAGEKNKELPQIFSGVSIKSPQEVFQNYKPKTRTIYNPAGEVNKELPQIFNGITIKSPQAILQNYKPQTRTIYNPAGEVNKELSQIFSGVSIKSPQEVFQKIIPKTHTIFNSAGDIKGGAKATLPQHFGGIVNIWEQIQKIPQTLASGGISSIMNVFNSAAGDNSLNQLEESSTFSAMQLGNLPLPQFDAPKIPATSTSNSTSSTTTNSTSSSVSLNFGDVNISNGMDFDNFTHKLLTLFNQSAANSAMA